MQNRGRNYFSEQNDIGGAELVNGEFLLGLNEQQTRVERGSHQMSDFEAEILQPFRLISPLTLRLCPNDAGQVENGDLPRSAFLEGDDQPLRTHRHTHHPFALCETEGVADGLSRDCVEESDSSEGGGLHDGADLAIFGCKEEIGGGEGDDAGGDCVDAVTVGALNVGFLRG